MKFSYKFSNLIGTVYRKGNIIFSSDGNSVLCPVGNKLSIYDLRNNRSYTLPIEARHDYSAIALSPNGLILIAAVQSGEVHIINLNFKRIVYRKMFGQHIERISFSPDGKHFAFTKANKVFVYAAPGASKRVFDPFKLERVLAASAEFVQYFDWSHDSRLLAIGGRDMMTRIYGAYRGFKNFRIYTLGSHRDTIMGVFFEEKTLDLHTVSRDGTVCSWECSLETEDLVERVSLFKKIKQEKDKQEEEEEDDIPELNEEIDEETDEKKDEKKDDSVKEFYYTRRARINLHTNFENKVAITSSAAYNKKTRMMVVAFTKGDFLLLDMNDEGAVVQSLNASNQEISSVAMNPSGDWVALGVSSLGQLLVWEWQSETYVLKQQGHFNSMRVVLYSPDGLNVASGGEDGKVKLWSTQSSFCFVTFSEHTGPVTGLTFTQSGKAILSSSLDGTVRAFDLTRYRNFKTLTSPRPTQFSCVSVDCAGELVVAGGQDSHEIYLWSLQTGRLLEVLAGHTGPVTSLEFSKEPGSTMLVSTGWDGTVKVWDAIANTTAKESIELLGDGLFVTFRPDGKQIAVATMDGQISTFDPLTGKQQGSISGKEDLGAGRSDTDRITAKKKMEANFFTNLCYSSDGQHVLAGGKSKNICIYSIEDEILVKKFEITQNRSFDAMDETINRRKLAENGINLALVEQREERNAPIKLPGVLHSDKSTRSFRPEVRVTSLHFSPTGRSWAASTSEGLLVYSLDDDLMFDPLYLDISNTPTAVRQKLKDKEYSTALMMAIRLNINSLKQEVMESIPVDIVGLVVSELSQMYVEGVLNFLGEILETTPHLGFYAKWASLLVSHHGQSLKSRSPQIMSILNSIQRSLTTHQNNLSKVCSHNEYMMKYLLAQGSLRRGRKMKTEDEDIAENELSHSEAESEEDIEDLFNTMEVES